MFCAKCGNQIPDGARFCPRCGFQIGAVPAAPATPAAPAESAVKRLYMDAKGLSLVNYKFEIRDQAGNLRYKAATVTEGMFTYNARVYYPNDAEVLAIHQQTKMTMMAINFDIVAPNGALVTQVMQNVKMTSYSYTLPQLGITVDGDFLAMNFLFYRNGQPIGAVRKKIMAWGDCYEVEYVDPSLEQVFLAMVMVVQMVIAYHRNHRRRR